MKNYLNGKKVYLSGAIHLCNNDGINWRESITLKLKSLGLEVLDPCKTIVNNDSKLSEIGKNKQKFRSLIKSENWEMVKKEFWPIVRKDLYMVDQSSFLICLYDPLLPTVGTIHELVVAQFEKKPILLLYKNETLKDFNPWICTFIKSNHFFSNEQLIIDYLKKVDSGEFDTSLWVL